VITADASRSYVEAVKSMGVAVESV
jgi:hypothetical protein